MTYFTVCCGYASHYHNTVTVEADTLDAALEKAIEQAGDDPHWRSVDQASQTFVEALAEGDGRRPLGRYRAPRSGPFHPERRTARGHADRPPPTRQTSMSRAAPSVFVSLKTPAPSRRRPPIRRPRRATSLWSPFAAEPMALRM